MKKLTIAAKRTFLLLLVSLTVLSGCGEKGVTQKEPASSSKEPEHDAEKTGETPSFTDEENSASESVSAIESESTPEFTAGTESLSNDTEGNETVSQKPDDHHLPCTAQFPSGTAVGMWDEKKSQINEDVWWITTDREFEDLMQKYPDANNGNPNLWVSPGWVESFTTNVLYYGEDGRMIRFGSPFHAYCSVLEEVSDSNSRVVLAEFKFDAYVGLDVAEFNIPVEEWLTEYWAVCFVQDEGDIYYSFYFSKKCFSKEEVIEFAKTVVFEEGAFQAK